MKRDLDLCRAILFQIEASEAVLVQHITVPTYNDLQVAYHLELLGDAGLVVVDDECHRLTWAGHEFLGTARESRLWQKTKATLEHAGVVSFEMAKCLLISLAKKELGI